MSAVETAPLSGTRKAAILLSILGDEAAATILKSLPEDELQRVTDEVASLMSVPFETALNVLEEFQQIVAAQDEFVRPTRRYFAEIC